MKILFVGQNLQMGGIQKALVNTIKELHKNNNYDIDIFLFGDGILTKEIPKNVKVYSGSLLLRLSSTPFSMVKNSGNLFHIFLRILCMILVRIMGSENYYTFLFKKQKKFENYDVAISYFNDVQNSYFNRGTNQFVLECVEAKTKIAWIHTDPLKAGFEYKTTLNTYKNFEKIVCVSKSCRSKFIELFPDYAGKTHVVYNFFPIKEIKSKSNEYNPPFEKNKISIISVGRIDNSTKRFHFIPQICKMLKDASLTNFQWKVIGDGPDIKSNKQLIKKLEISDFVEFIGEKENPYPYIKESDIFVLTSAYEGYPMVVSESLILGTPVVTTCYSAVNEQLIDNYNGVITEMELNNIFIKVKNLLENPGLINSMKENNKKSGVSNSIAQQQFSRVVEKKKMNN